MSEGHSRGRGPASSQASIPPYAKRGAGRPRLLQRAGKAACFAADEFFAAKISNPHTRRAYARPVGRFLTWCEAQGIELRQVTPGLAGRFIEDLPGSDPTKNLALAALRHFFDTLVTRHAVALNPFASVRGRQDARADDSASAGVAWLPGPVKRRGAAGSGGAGGADLHRGPRGSPGAPRSGRVDRRLPGSGRHRPVPQSRAPVFGGGKGGVGLTDRPMTAHGVRQMLKRRLHEAGLPEIITPHSFRVMVVTDLLGQNVPMEDVQYLVGHSNPQTTQIYDRRRRRVTRNIVERISV